MKVLLIALISTFPDVKDPLVLMGGTRDERWLQSGVDYASYLGIGLSLVDSSHSPVEFYAALKPTLFLLP